MQCEVLALAFFLQNVSWRNTKYYSVYRFFEGASSEGSSFLSVDAVTCDRHQVTFRGHHVTKQRQVSIVDVGTVKRNDVVHFSFDGFSDRFYAETLETRCMI